jgi:hypothetical protein
LILIDVYTSSQKYVFIKLNEADGKRETEISSQSSAFSYQLFVADGLLTAEG